MSYDLSDHTTQGPQEHPMTTVADRIAAALAGANISIPEGASTADITRALINASIAHKRAENDGWSQLSRLRNDAKRDEARAAARAQREKHAECLALLNEIGQGGAGVTWDRAAVGKAAEEIAATDWRGGYRTQPTDEWAITVVTPHIGTDDPHAVRHAVAVYRGCFERWMLAPSKSPA